MSLNQEQLFTMALGLEKPWFVSRIEFDPDEGQIDLYLDFKRGSKFGCPDCGKETPVYDAEEHTWRHMNFFQYKPICTPGSPEPTALIAACSLSMCPGHAQRAISRCSLKPSRSP
jgi:hypothetical protein